LASDLNVGADDAAKRFEIDGYIFPSLNFEWKNAKITDSFSEETYPVRQQVPLKYFEAYMLRPLLRQRFNVKVILIQNKKFYPVQISGVPSLRSTPEPTRQRFQPSTPPIWTTSSESINNGETIEITDFVL
jgi:hypothetical protein